MGKQPFPPDASIPLGETLTSYEFMADEFYITSPTLFKA